MLLGLLAGRRIARCPNIGYLRWSLKSGSGCSPVFLRVFATGFRAGESCEVAADGETMVVFAVAMPPWKNSRAGQRLARQERLRRAQLQEALEPLLAFSGHSKCLI